MQARFSRLARRDILNHGYAILDNARGIAHRRTCHGGPDAVPIFVHITFLECVAGDLAGKQTFCLRHIGGQVVWMGNSLIGLL